MSTEEEQNLLEIRKIEQELNQLEIADVERQLAAFDDEFPPFDVHGEPIPDKPKVEQEEGFGDKLMGAAEAATTLITGATTGTLGGMVGFGKGIADVVQSGDFGTPQGAKTVQKSFEEGLSNLTFAPQTKTGQRYVEGIGEVARHFEPVAGLSQISAVGQAVSKGARGGGSFAGKDLSSLRESQRLLENDAGGGLTAFQTGQASNMRNFMEHLGDLGLFSEGRKDHRNSQNAITISNELQKMVDGLDPTLVKSAGDLGESVFELIQTGNKAAGELYAKDLAEISSKFGDIQINTKPIVETLEAWKKANSSELGTNLDNSSLAVANQFIAKLNSTKTPEEKGLAAFVNRGRVAPSNDPHASVQALIEFEGFINNEISKKADFKSDGFNAVATRQLSQLSKELRDSINDAYANQGYGELATAHKTAKNTLSNIKDQLLPKVTKSTIESLASREDFNAFGKILLSSTNKRKIEAFMDSIDVAHQQATKAGKKLELTPQEMKQSLRQSYLDNIFGNVAADPDSVFSNKYNKIKKDLGNKSSREAIKAVLGEDFPNYVKVVNALEAASKEQKNNLFGFVVRGKQLSSMLQIGAGMSAAVGGTALAGSGVGIGAAMAVLAAPNVLSWAATRPSVVNKLLNLNKIDLSDSTAAPRLAAVQINGIIESLDEKDKAFIIDAMKEKQLTVESLEEQQ